ncbi:MAG: hypothetical protein CL946_06105 [Ectothiorhodospiraceae bacterium]|nr:hypothetical protein [Ectothiorhodospiraceae bacterium]
MDWYRTYRLLICSTGLLLLTLIAGPAALIGQEPESGTQEQSPKLANTIDLREDFHTPNTTLLQQNEPNPFTGTTVIRYRLEDHTKVQLRVYDEDGEMIKELVNTRQVPGSYKVSFDAKGLEAGKYNYVLSVDGKCESRMLTIKE